MRTSSPSDRPARGGRAALLWDESFLWGVMARQGQVWGNRQAGSEAWVTNGFNFSYPGYHELFGGFADPNPRLDADRARY
jgi:hypothetical protein